MVIRFSTTSKIGVAKSPGGRPTRLTVPRRRAMWIACANAGGETAVTSTPCAPPLVAFITCSTASGDSAFTATSAPRVRASASFSSVTSSATTCSPIALAYCTATCPRPPMPEIATHSPGRASVSFSPL